ncbi:MAG: hypothetical protein AB7K68_04310 [Bacteriovoracia bacterium]
MIIQLVIALASFTQIAHAERRAEIYCKPAQRISDGGSYVEIMEKDGVYHYTFTKSSFAGPSVIADFPVSIERDLSDSGCELKILKSATLDHRFSVIQRKGSTKWTLMPISDKPKSKVSELVCEVKASVSCEPAKKSSAPVIVPLCNDANADSPLCSGGASAD